MIYLDTNVLVAYINPKDKLHDKALSLIARFKDEELVVSQLTIVELYSVFSRVMNISDIEVEALVNYTLRKCNTKIASIEWDELYTLAIKYANKLKLKTLDLLHVVAAKLVDAKAIASFDKDINNKGHVIENQLGIKVVGF